MPTTALVLAHRIAGPVARVLLRAQVIGREHVPRRGGVVLAANHVSNLDNYLLTSACPRPPLYLGKHELARGVFGAFNTAMGMVPVDRGSGDAGPIDDVARLLCAGELVAMFPEGTRSPTGELFRFRSGTARVAAAAGVPVVPVGLRGTGQVWPRGSRPRWGPPGRGELSVWFGTPMDPPPDSGRARRLWTQQLRARVADLAAQPLAEAFAPVDRR